ncbi:hypothetical protein PGTUg99_017899 [Puccinia graminis f. sp. tritici]|uniref:Uncharacterized protein n=1 Tax=Puccinia graminis f. sp. tritici TaxID=56615 RepID=A0A5B0PG25_PUCGR|nr:hypothetical protein PGTUg99_017899 [Puccinia graminis f. sp. tritici]
MVVLVEKPGGLQWLKPQSSAGLYRAIETPTHINKRTSCNIRPEGKKTITVMYNPNHPTMSFINISQRAYIIKFALVALIVTLRIHSGQAVGGRRQQCGYHFFFADARQKRVSCMQDNQHDNQCAPESCTSDIDGFKWDQLEFWFCHPVDGFVLPRPIKPAQYFRRDSYAEVQEAGTPNWFRCAYSYKSNRQMMICNDCL